MYPSIQWSEMATQFMAGGAISMAVVALAVLLLVQFCVGIFRAAASRRQLRGVDSRLHQLEMQFDHFMMQRLRIVNEAASQAPATAQLVPVRDRRSAVQDIHAA